MPIFRKLEIKFTQFLLEELDSPVIKTLERIRFSSNQNIGEGESNSDEKMLKKFSTDQRFIRKRNTTYNIETLFSGKNPKFKAYSYFG